MPVLWLQHKTRDLTSFGSPWGYWDYPVPQSHTKGVVADLLQKTHTHTAKPITFNTHQQENRSENLTWTALSSSWQWCHRSDHGLPHNFQHVRGQHQRAQAEGEDAEREQVAAPEPSSTGIWRGLQATDSPLPSQLPSASLSEDQKGGDSRGVCWHRTWARSRCLQPPLTLNGMQKWHKPLISVSLDAPCTWPWVWP